MGCGASAPHAGSTEQLTVSFGPPSLISTRGASRPPVDISRTRVPLFTRAAELLTRTAPPRLPPPQHDPLRDTPRGMPHLDERLDMRSRFQTEALLLDKGFPKNLTGYDIIGLIGEGACARVYLAEPMAVRESKPLGESMYAMKVMCKADIDKRGKQEDIARERKLLQLAAGHPFVLNAHACFESANFEFLVLDHCPGSDLFGEYSSTDELDLSGTFLTDCLQLQRCSPAFRPRGWTR